MTELCSRVRLLPPSPGMASWTDLRAAAVAFAEHDWPVMPGTYQLAEHSSWLGKKGEPTGLMPVDDNWTSAATTDPAVAQDVWTNRPYSILLRCGVTVDAIEIPAGLGNAALAALRDKQQVGPIAITPFDTWMLLVKAGVPLLPKLAERVGISLRAHSTWVPLPPTERARIPYRWRMSPVAVGWAMPSSGAVQNVLVDVTSTRYGSRRAAAPAVPR